MVLSEYKVTKPITCIHVSWFIIVPTPKKCHFLVAKSPIRSSDPKFLPLAISCHIQASTAATKGALLKGLAAPFAAHHVPRLRRRSRRRGGLRGLPGGQEQFQGLVEGLRIPLDLVRVGLPTGCVVGCFFESSEKRVAVDKESSQEN